MKIDTRYNEFGDNGFSAGYPNNDMRTNDAYEKLLQNIDKVPIEKIEQLLEEYKIY